jgi:Low-density lipoprotein receptor repeat class B
LRTRRFRSLGGWLAALLALSAAAAGNASAKVYFSAFPAEGGTGIERAGFDGSGLETLAVEPTGFDEGIALDVAHGQMYWTDSIASVIYRANLGGGEPQVIVDDLGWEPLGIALDPLAGKLYWNDRQGIKRANLDGGNPELLIEGSTSGLMTLDLSARRMYWIGASGAKIRSAPMEPAEGELEVTEPVVGQSKTFGLAVDPAHGKLYWLELEHDQIRRSNLEGGEIETIVSQPERGFEGGLAVDPAAGRLYWTAAGTETAPRDEIEASNLAGGEVQTLFGTGEDIPEALAVETSEPHPAAVLAPSIEGAAQVGSPVSCNPGVWSGLGPISTSYSWLANGSVIEGVSGSVYVPAASQAGASLACAVSATDDVETSTAQSAPVSVAGLAPPDAPAPHASARLVAGIALAHLTSSGRKARVPVFASVACSVVLSARPLNRRRARGRRARRAPRARRRRAPRAKTLSVHMSLRGGRSRVTLAGLIRGRTYLLTLTAHSADGQVVHSTATLQVAHR